MIARRARLRSEGAFGTLKAVAARREAPEPRFRCRSGLRINRTGAEHRPVHNAWSNCTLVPVAR